MINTEALLIPNIAPRVGSLESGAMDNICDIDGITVGHFTLHEDKPHCIRSGVTVINPNKDKNLFIDKIPAAVSVINGFGKSYGLIQLEELGTIETPIALTNTFSVPIVAQAQIKKAIDINSEIGRSLPTVNSLVLECNDGFLNDIQALAINEEHYLKALSNCKTHIEQGAVGAGHGMKCFGFKGGIGSASRISAGLHKYTVGALVLSNFGALPNLRIAGLELGKKFASHNVRGSEEAIIHDSHDKGSIIIIIATDAPLDSRQLKRLSLRAAAGLARTGSNFGHGSGDICVAFSNAYSLKQSNSMDMNESIATVNEGQINYLFDAAAEATEQAIINSLWFAKSTKGRDGNECRNLHEVIMENSSILGLL
ncbi:aminopeptidase DmpA [Taylorella asinigenitalis 14/45]|uniref:Aminopeptidase DmpA n=1 Tax=Taylorella asinigenitalis 14/45 TaxID=1091495 RepID=I7JRU4_9BURK|nr:P1 family peptidase [Taylorella asinigenitalis]CCG19821.1 aminopeptidase DmpA [Taylorella asinigenitalis 14/45]